MHQRRLIRAEFDLASLHFLHRLGNIHRNRASFGIRHQPLRPKNLTQPPHRLHHVRSGDQSVEVSPVFLSDLLDHIFAANIVRARLFSLANFFAAGNHQNFFGLA